jgi:hypothetical protein
MKKPLRSGAAVLALLCFSSFIYLKVKEERLPFGSDSPITRVCRFGWPFSPWLTYKTNVR